MGLWTVWRGWGLPLSSIISSMPSMLGRKHTNTLTHLHMCWFWLFFILLKICISSAINRNAVVVILAGFLIDKLGNRCMFAICFEMSLGFRRQKNGNKLVSVSFFLQLGCFCFLSCVFWARPCSPWVPTSKELPVFFHSCSQAVCCSDQAMDLWPVRTHHVKCLSQGNRSLYKKRHNHFFPLTVWH